MKRISLLVVIAAGIIFPAAAWAGDTFYITPSYDYSGRETITATARQTSTHAYFYVEDDYWNGLSFSQQNTLQNNLNNLASQFDLVIYPKARNVFGTEWKPGIDGDSRITILFTHLKSGIGGYLKSADGYPKSEKSNSNEREMIYLNVLHTDIPRMKSFIAHEFQHLITFYNKNILHNLEEDRWLNEARSEYAPTAVGYDDIYSGSNLETRVRDFLRQPSDSLTNWSNSYSDYASVNLFMQYLTDHYGETILGLMVDNDKAGIASINQALSSAGYSDNFSNVFTNWTIANYLNNTSLGEGKYGYLNPNLSFNSLHVSPTATYTISSRTELRLADLIKDWTPYWFQFKGGDGNNLKLEFTSRGETADFQVPYIITKRDGQQSVKFMSFENQTATVYIPNFGDEVYSVVMIPSNQHKTTDFNGEQPSTYFSFAASTVVLSEILVTDVSPTTGLPAGGTAVTISGVNFLAGAKVTFGGLEASQVRVIDSNTITAVVPAHPAGSVDVVVINPDGQEAKLANGFSYSQAVEIVDGSLIRATGDYKVYIVNGDYKRWIQNPKIFDFYGHLSWDKIIEVTPEIRDSYKDAWLVRAANDPRVYELNGDGTKHWLNMTPEQFTATGRSWDMVYIINSAERDFYLTGAAVTIL